MPILSTKLSAWGAFGFSPGVFCSGKVLDDLSGAMLQCCVYLCFVVEQELSQFLALGTCEMLDGIHLSPIQHQYKTKGQDEYLVHLYLCTRKWPGVKQDSTWVGNALIVELVGYGDCTEFTKLSWSCFIDCSCEMNSWIEGGQNTENKWRND